MSEKISLDSSAHNSLNIYMLQVKGFSVSYYF
jgi:hypothetical protein